MGSNSEENSKTMNKPLKIILGVILVLVIAAGSFYGGMVFGKNQSAASAATVPMNFPEGFQPPDGAALPGDGTGRFGARGQGGAAGDFAAQPGMIFGEIQSIDGDTLLIVDANGAQKSVQVTKTTLIEKNASVEITDLATGEIVIVSGSENDDGSVTARSVQVAQAGRMLGGPAQ
jgi:hypothetical protein